MAALLHYQTIDSTNEEARRLAKSMKPLTPTAIVAETQTQGRGQYGHTWYSHQEGGLYYSYVYPNAAYDITQIPSYHHQVCQIICQAILLQTNLKTHIKEPNDILINQKKVCGILIEAGPMKNNKVPYIIFGIGININQPVFPKYLHQKATSLFLETGKTYQKAPFIQYFTDHLTQMCESYHEDN